MNAMPISTSASIANGPSVVLVAPITHRSLPWVSCSNRSDFSLIWAFAPCGLAIWASGLRVPGGSLLSKEIARSHVIGLDHEPWAQCSFIRPFLFYIRKSLFVMKSTLTSHPLLQQRTEFSNARTSLHISMPQTNSFLPSLLHLCPKKAKPGANCSGLYARMDILR